jgi:asparagine synthase (glutamine-hydrolysing)
LEGGYCLKVSNRGSSLISYWDWSLDTPGPVESSMDIKKELYTEFMDSIEYRSISNNMHFAALSGGLDSRLVVAGLVEMGRKVTTLNVSWPETLDQILARQVASTLNTAHLETNLLPHEAGEHFFPKSTQLIRNLGFQGNSEESNQIWGGNDGSISVGYVYVYANVIEKLRAGDIEQAAQLFIDLKGCNLSHRIFKKEFKAMAGSQAINSLIEEFKTISREDDGQKLFIYLLRANQRRMMHNDIENIDLLPYERIEPFFDTKFLSLTCALPIDASIGHGFYYDWLSEFPISISTIPWQSYPTHKPCPRELPKNAVDQWYCAQQVLSNAKRKFLPNAFSELIARKSTLEKRIHFIDWNMLKMIKYANKLGVADGTFAMEQAIKACKHIQ